MQPISFITSLLTFYLKGEFNFEQNFIRLKIPNTVLKLIPLGSYKKSIPVDQVSSTNTDFHLDLKSLLFGIVLVIFSYYRFSDSFLSGIVLLLGGIAYIISAFVVTFTITTTSSEVVTLNILIFQKSVAESMQKQIDAIINARLNDTNNRQQTNRSIYANAQQTDRIIEAINNK